ncbi:MAG: MoaD/ThiS family protein [Candidatus Heimdallarchaeaceae archaeon]
MKVKFQCFGQVRSITKEAIVELEIKKDSSIKKAIEQFVKEFGQEMEEILFSEGELRKFYIVQVDKNNVNNDKLHEEIVKEGQIISIIPFVAGG